MNIDVIQDWTDTIVEMNCGNSRDVRYKVFTDGTRRIQEIRDTDGTLIRKQELPQGMVNGSVGARQRLTSIAAQFAGKRARDGPFSFVLYLSSRSSPVRCPASI
jgi:hypothetical protein